MRRILLGSGGSCVIVATAGHRKGLADRLAECSIDLRKRPKTGRYIALDAQETLVPVLVEGRPNGDLFSRAIEPMLERAESAAMHEPGGRLRFRRNGDAAMGSRSFAETPRFNSSNSGMI